MAGSKQLSVLKSDFNPAPVKKRSAEDIRAEIARVDAAIADLAFDAPRGWRVLGSVSVPIALRSLRKYRQRLARLA